jgi:hypothetical protein
MKLVGDMLDAPRTDDAVRASSIATSPRNIARARTRRA